MSNCPDCGRPEVADWDHEVLDCVEQQLLNSEEKVQSLRDALHSVRVCLSVGDAPTAHAIIERALSQPQPVKGES